MSIGILSDFPFIISVILPFLVGRRKYKKPTCFFKPQESRVVRKDIAYVDKVHGSVRGFS